MKIEQPSFFKARGNPLEDRVGKDFFDELPQAPGVYLMYGQAGQVLYVGKSTNLRKRLFSYRRASAGKNRSKLGKLVRMARRIEIIRCEDEEAALLKENALIREHRPDFNGAKKSPETYYFITLKAGASKLQFRLAMGTPDDPALLPFTYGCFKGHRTVRRGTGALLRQLYLLEHDIKSPFEFPAVLTGKLTPLAYQIPIQQHVVGAELLQDFLDGQSISFIEKLVDQVNARGLFGEYVGRLILKNYEALKQLYDRCLHQNHQLKQKLNLSDG